MELQFIFCLFFLLFFLFRLVRKCKPQSTTQKLPPGPPKLPLIGNLHQLAGSLPHHSLRDLARKYGPLMHLQLGEVSAIVISSPGMAKEVMKTHDIAFASRPELLASKILFYEGTDVAFAPYGDYWRQMRKFCMVELLSAKNVRSFSSIRDDETLRLIKSIQSSSGLSMNLTEKLFSLTSAIVCRAAFGKVCRDKDEFTMLLCQAMLLAGGFDLADLFPSMKLLHVVSGMKPKLEKLHRKLDQIIGNIINQHRENHTSTKGGNGESGEEDLIDVLLRVKESGGLDFPITTNNIKAIIFDMFTGGTETSASTIEWAMSELMRKPIVMEKVQAELRQAFKGKKRISESDIEGLRYLKLVIKETLRLHPAFPLLGPRECREQCEIDGYTIPIKTKVIVNGWAIGRNPEYWHDPENFEPERFENSSIDFAGSHFEFIPFGAGRRMCPGMSFGLASVELPLAQILYQFDWKLPDGIRPDELDMTDTSGATARRRNDLYLIASSYDPSLNE